MIDIGDGSKERPYTHATKKGTDRQNKVCKCHKCGGIERCTPIRDFWGAEGQPLLCDDCRGAYGKNDLPKEF